MVRWNLEDIYSFKDTSALIASVRKLSEEFAGFRSRLTPALSPDAFVQMVKKKEEIAVLMAKLQGFAGLWLSENTADAKRNAHESKISELAAEVSNVMVFFDVWFKGLDDTTASKYIRASGPYNYLLRQMRAFKPHTLGEKEEQVISLKDLTGCQELVRLYDMVANKFTFEWKGKSMTLEEVNKFKQSPSREDRKQSYDLVLGRYAAEQDVLGEMYKGIVNDWRNEQVKLRKFSRPISVRNLSNDVPDAAVETLLSVVRKNTGVFERYYQMKGKLLGLKKFDRYDLYAPFSPKERRYSFDECKDLTLGTYRQFGEQAFRYAKKIFDDKHVHSEVSK
ncbi:hypothetical protein HY490_03870, partial [Candidatus Woesearchaeota archaeon]|nr:hypothetical protein [Candidatus Woesearchaeota archaeon]